MFNLDHVPSVPPSQAEWDQRRSEYDELWLDAMYAKSTTTSQHVANLRFELERCYCSGAWIACIVLSAAVVEIHLSNLGGWKGPKAIKLLEKLNVVGEVERLKNRRNQLMHGEVGMGGLTRLPSEEYINGRYFLAHEAMISVGLALRVALSDLWFE